MYPLQNGFRVTDIGFFGPCATRVPLARGGAEALPLDNPAPLAKDGAHRHEQLPQLARLAVSGDLPRPPAASAGLAEHRVAGGDQPLIYCP
jgi:hypothetical protein